MEYIGIEMQAYLLSKPLLLLFYYLCTHAQKQENMLFKP